MVKKTQQFALGYLEASRCRELPFHNVQHTLDVFLGTITIGQHQKIDTKDLEPVLLAALLHDLGNAHCLEGHEQISIEIAENYLLAQGYGKTKTAMVVYSIQATKMPQKPRNTLGSILCDADLFHLGTSDFLVKNRALRKEWKEFNNREFSDEDWYRLNIDFMDKHSYFTSYGKQILEGGKARNLRLLEQKLKIVTNG